MKYIIRELNGEDLTKGFFETLSNLSTMGSISNEKQHADEIMKKIKENNDYKILVAEDIQTHEIIGSATLLIEQKFIRNGGKAGHIEDVVTRKGYEGKGIGKGIIQSLIDIAKKNGCYKITLDCDEKLVEFYEKAGFKKKGIMMRINL